MMPSAELPLVYLGSLAALAERLSDAPQECDRQRPKDLRLQKWKTCPHPWYLDFQRDNVRYRDNLDKLIGRHAPDFTAAKDEARRAIVAKLEGRDPKGLVPADDPTLAQMLDAYDRERPRRDRWQIGRIVQDRAPLPDRPAAVRRLAREYRHAPRR